MTRRLVNVAAVAVALAERSSFFCLGFNVGPSSLFFSPSTTSSNCHRPCRRLNNNILVRQCATSSNAEIEETKNRRISRNLYRELLRWSQQSGQAEQYPDSILECLEVPPVTFWAPEDVDEHRMELLDLIRRGFEIGDKPLEKFDYYEVILAQKALRLLPPKCDFGRRRLVAPVLSFSGLRGIVRAIFRFV